MSIGVVGNYRIIVARCLGPGWIGNYEFLPLGDRIPVGPEFGWWRPTRRWAEAAVRRRIRREGLRWPR